MLPAGALTNDTLTAAADRMGKDDIILMLETLIIRIA